MIDLAKTVKRDTFEFNALGPQFVLTAVSFLTLTSVFSSVFNAIFRLLGSILNDERSSAI
jgi:hypothetical protein